MSLVTRCVTEIAAAPDAVWAVVSDIQNAEHVISGIKKIEILEAPEASSIIGTKWQETREWMGRDVVEVMWVTDARAPIFYETRAESHGSVYTSRIELEPVTNSTRLSMSFSCEPQSLMARLMWVLTGWMARKSIVSAIGHDLADIRSAVERDAGRFKKESV